jgi:Ca2+/Na+ antiporter
MGSAAFTILSVYTAITHKSESWLLTVAIILALALFAIASYKTWHEQYDRAEKEILKNAKPDIRREAFGFKTGIKGTSQVRGKSYASAEFGFTVIACNHRQAKTSIRDVVLDGNLLSPPVVFLQVSEMSASAGVKPKTSQETMLDYGIHKTLSLSCSAVVEGTPTDISLDNLAVNIVDGFGGYHPIQVKAGESLHL